MNNAIKGALLSGLVFPGLGQLVLRQYLSQDLVVMYPDREALALKELDSLESFTRKSIEQVLAGKDWFQAYAELDADLLD